MNFGTLANILNYLNKKNINTIVMNKLY